MFCFEKKSNYGCRDVKIDISFLKAQNDENCIYRTFYVKDQF